MLTTRRHRRRLFSLHLKWRSRSMKCEGTKPNDSAGLEGAGLEYRRKAHLELESKFSKCFLKLTTVTRSKVSRKTWIEELNFRLAKMSDETKFTQLTSTSNSYLKHETQISVLIERKNSVRSKQNERENRIIWNFSEAFLQNFFKIGSLIGFNVQNNFSKFEKNSPYKFYGN